MVASEAIVLASLARLIQPIVNDIYSGAKKIGVRGLARWEQKTSWQKIARRIKTIEQVRTIWRPEGAISIREFFHPPKFLYEKKPIRISRINELPGNATIVQGIVGQGKSVMMRSLAIEELLGNDAKWLPLFLELKDLSPKLGLTEAIYKLLDSYDIDVDADTIDYLFKSGKLSLLLDGFDELDQSIIKETSLEIEHLIRKYPELRIVISSRPGHEIQKSTSFEILPIAPIVESEYSAFFERLRVDAKKSQSLRQAIRSSPSKIGSLITTPLMLTLVVLVYESDSEIPDTLPEFFDGLFQVVFTRHDRQKANFNRKHHSGLPERKLQQLFEAFSFMTLQMGHSRVISHKQFEDVFDNAIAYCDGIKCEVDEFKQDMIKVACLLLEDGIDSITYLHKSILEYFSASFVRRLNDENAELFYTAAQEKARTWIDVLLFLKSIDALRYSKYYVLPTVSRHQKDIVAPLSQMDSASAQTVISKLYPEMGVYYKEEAGSYHRKAIGSLHPRAGEEIGDFGFLILDAISNAAPDNCDNLYDTFGGAPVEIDKALGFHIPAKLFFKIFGKKELSTAVGIFESRLLSIKQEAEKIIAGEVKKRLIFLNPNISNKP